jgi:hypothetical protein
LKPNSVTHQYIYRTHGVADFKKFSTRHGAKLDVPGRGSQLQRQVNLVGHLLPSVQRTTIRAPTSRPTVRRRGRKRAVDGELATAERSHARARSGARRAPASCGTGAGSTTGTPTAARRARATTPGRTGTAAAWRSPNLTRPARRSSSTGAALRSPWPLPLPFSSLASSLVPPRQLLLAPYTRAKHMHVVVPAYDYERR